MGQNLNLTPSEQGKLADYVKACELTKKNSATYERAYTGCVERESSSIGILPYVLTGAGGFVLGLLLGLGRK